MDGIVNYPQHRLPSGQQTNRDRAKGIEVSVVSGAIEGINGPLKLSLTVPLLARLFGQNAVVTWQMATHHRHDGSLRGFIGFGHQIPRTAFFLDLG